MYAIRSVDPEQWQTYRAIRLRALLDSPDAFGSTYEIEVARPDDQWLSRISGAATSGKDRVVFSVMGENVCGLAWCKVSALEPGVADLFQMWVDPGFRGLGIGAALLQDAVDYARGAGVDILRLGVTVAESPAMRLYSSFGFKPVGAVESLREGSAISAQAMQLHLSAAIRRRR
ncbi:MAG: hypothetical protein RL375_2574 [Pseudomonadota bacterium]|jgi:ribosomal protein S18 acetylase RimI-like enzyme